MARGERLLTTKHNPISWLIRHECGGSLPGASRAGTCCERPPLWLKMLPLPVPVPRSPLQQAAGARSLHRDAQATKRVEGHVFARRPGIILDPDEMDEQLD